MGSMRKTAPASRGRTPDSVERYIARTPEPAHDMLIALRAAIRSVLPRDATETISYRMPAFKRDGIVVWYAAFADHCSLFPGGSVLGRFKDQIAGYRTSKGTIQFPLDKRLPIRLIKQIVKARVSEQAARARLRSKRRA